MRIDSQVIEKTILRLRSWFPPRQVYFRSNGVVHYTAISSRLQVGGAALLILILGWVAYTSIHFLSRDMVLESRDQTIKDWQSSYAELNGEMTDIKTEVLERTARLEARQSHLNDLITIQRDPGAVGGGGRTTPISPTLDVITTDEAAEASEASDEQASLSLGQPGLIPVGFKIGVGEAIDPSALEMGTREFESMLLRQLDTVQMDQDHIASGLDLFAKNRLASIRRTLATAGVNEEQINTASPVENSSGGPFIPVIRELDFANTGKGKTSEQAFAAMHESWIEMFRVEEFLQSVPSVDPAASYYVSSRFGPRTDPLKKTPAFHPGLDMSGWTGTEIFASAPGTVRRVGPFGPYGNMVEIDHGNGYLTRYGHLRRTLTKIGAIVQRGELIGEMGNSGRVTGTHLHFEIWLNGELQDPLPYIKVAEDVLKIQRQTGPKK